MIALEIVVDEASDVSLRDAILPPLRAYNESRVGPFKAKNLAILLRDPESQAITGGLWGYSTHDWLLVDLLVVPETQRNRGIGSALMRKAEDVAVARGCVGIWLQTATFQAPGFYQKLGYTLFGRLPNRPRGHDTAFYCKVFQP